MKSVSCYLLNTYWQTFPHTESIQTARNKNIMHSHSFIYQQIIRQLLLTHLCIDFLGPSPVCYTLDYWFVKMLTPRAHQRCPAMDFCPQYLSTSNVHHFCYICSELLSNTKAIYVHVHWLRAIMIYRENQNITSINHI